MVILGFITLLRVIVLIAAATLVWVPIGIAIGLRPKVARIAQPVAQFSSLPDWANFLDANPFS